MRVQAGSTFGDYVVESQVGLGGMGAVYLATDERLGRRVALKLLSTDLASQPSFRDRFIAESRIAASLDHPHIVPIYEAGEVDGQLFIAMRYVAGVDLAVLLTREGALPPERAVRIISQIADALDAAHAAGLIHRDVKPGNILLATTSAGDDHAYLTDFGLTKHAGYGPMTRTGQLVGTVDYVAPEQVEGRPIDSRADIYSLACVLFETLSGEPPFRRETDMAVLFAHVQSPMPSVRKTRPEVPAALDKVLAKGAAKDPDARYATAGDFARAASAALTDDKPQVIGGAKPPTRITGTVGSGAGGRRVVVVGAAVAMLGLLGYAATAGLLAPVATPSPPSSTAVAATAERPSGAARVTPALSAAASSRPSPFVPSGTRIIFSRQEFLGPDVERSLVCDVDVDAKLYVVDPDHPDSAPYRLLQNTDLFEQRPSWSADGSTISFTADVSNGSSAIFLTTPSATSPYQVVLTESTGLFAPQFPGYPRVSGDGSRLAWAFGQLWVTDPRSWLPRVVRGISPDDEHPEAPAQATELPPDARVAVVTVDWTPDGDLVAVVSTPPVRDTAPPLLRLERISSDGSSSDPVDIGVSAYGFVRSVAVSPEGTRIAIEAGYPESVILVGNLDGSAIEQVSPAGVAAHWPAWSPDGKRLAYTDGRDVFAIDTAGSPSIRLTDLAADDAFACNPTWGNATSDLISARPDPSSDAVRVFERGVLDAGRYRVSMYQPNIEFTVPEGWQGQQNYVDGWEIRRRGLSLLPDGAEGARDDIRTIVSARLQVGYTGGCREADTVVIGERPTDVVDWLESRPDLRTTPAQPVNLGGFTGLATDVTLAQGCRGDQPAVIFLGGEDEYLMEAGDRTRFITVDVRGVPVTILVSANGDVFDEFVVEAQPVIDSISFPSP